MRKLAFLAALITITTPSLAVPPPISAYGELPRVERGAISPNGKHMALISHENGERVLQLISNNQVIKNIPVGEAKIRDITWANDALLMVEISRTEKLSSYFTTDKAELYRTLLIPLDGRPTEWLFAKQKQIAPITYGWYGTRTIDGRPYAFFGGIEQKRNTATGSFISEYVFEGGEPSLFRVDLTDFTAKRVSPAPPEGSDRQWLIDKNGNIGATLDRRSSDGRWKIMNAKDQLIAEGQNRVGYTGILSFGADGNSLIYYVRDEEEGSSSHYEIPLAGGTPVPFLQEESVDQWLIDPKTSTLIGYRRSGDEFSVKMFDPAKEKQVQKIARAFPNRMISLSDWDRDFNIVLAHSNGNKDPGSWWIVDLVQLQAGIVGFERPDIEADNVGKISRINYTATDGLEMDGILTLPSGRKAENLPVVMLPHGGPTSENRPEFDWWAQAIASRGYAVFQPNFRGSTNRNVEFVRAGYGQWGRKMQTDISDGLSHLAKQGIIDPKRACIVGASYGGYAALAGVTLQQGLYRCSVAVAGVSDLSLLLSTDIAESGDDPLLKRNLKNEIGSGKDLKEVSPRRFAENADAPILLIHGKDDIRVPYKQSQVMADALKDAGKPYEFVTLVEEDHWLSREKTRLQMLEATIAFIEKYNPPDSSLQ